MPAFAGMTEFRTFYEFVNIALSQNPLFHYSIVLSEA